MSSEINVLDLEATQSAVIKNMIYHQLNKQKKVLTKAHKIELKNVKK